MIVIIGAGISGLTLAYHLQKLKKEFVLVEKSASVGGYIKTASVAGYQLELGPNSLLADADLLNFLAELGLENELIEANEVSKSRFIFKDGRYRSLPSDPFGILFTNFFSFQTKLAIVQEYFKKPKRVENESLATFFRRRFNAEIVDYALDPFVSGIYAGDVEKLAIEATFPNLKRYELENGSVLKGLIKNTKGVTRKKSLSFKFGMQAFPDTIQHLISPQHLLLNTEIKSIARKEGKWMVKTSKDLGIEAMKIVIATPASKAAEILYPNFNLEGIAAIRYAPMAVVHTVYKKADMAHPLNGFGGLNPLVEKQFSLGSIWTSSLFDGRCKPDEVMFTSFIGGDKQKHKLVENEPWQIKMKVHQELCRNYKITTEEPQFQHIYQWEKALPQYESSIFEAWKEVELLEKENIFICANWKDGVSLSDCIKNAEKLAQTI